MQLAATPAPAAPVIRDAARQAMPAGLVAAPIEKVAYDDPRLERAFDDPEFDSTEFGGVLRSDRDWPMDFIYGPSPTHAAGTDFMAAVAAANQLGKTDFGGVSAVLQGKDGVYYLDDSLSAGFYGDGGGDWELASGDLESVSVDSPEVVAVVDADGWFDLRPRT